MCSRFQRFFLAPLWLAVVACSSDEGPSSSASTGGRAGSGGASGSSGGSSGGPANGGAKSGGTSGAGSGGLNGGAIGATGGDGGESGDTNGESAGGSSGTSATGGTAGAVSGGTGAGAAAGGGGKGTAAGGAPPSTDLEPFSFFVASLEGMQRLSGSDDGFGGDLRYGEADGLTGADKICTELAEHSMPGSADKIWRAFLSAARGPDGTQVDAIDRIGEGPWYDRLGRVVAMNVTALQNTRPMGADSDIINDLPNEFGVPNHAPDPAQGEVDNHHILTGSDAEGRLYGANSTCDSWTSLSAGRPRVGFSWPAGGRQHWISGQDEGGCGAGVNIRETGGSDPSNPIVGSGGGYGGIYCFALTP